MQYFIMKRDRFLKWTEIEILFACIMPIPNTLHFHRKKIILHEIYFNSSGENIYRTF